MGFKKITDKSWNKHIILKTEAEAEAATGGVL